MDGDLVIRGIPQSARDPDTLSRVHSEPTRQDSRPRIDHIDAFRALAALFVLVHHAWAMAYPPQQGIAPEGIWRVTSWAKFGPFGVTIFIVLAGYSLTLGAARRNGSLPPGGVWTFIRRRARRIIPPYWAALGITTVLALLVLDKPTGTHWDLSVPFTWKGLAADTLLLQDVPFLDARNVAYTFWSIAVEWHIYFTFPLLLLIWRRAGPLVAAGSGFLIAVAAEYAAIAVPELASAHPIYYGLFALGMGACALVSNPPSWAHRLPWLLIALSAAMLWCVPTVVALPQAVVPIMGPETALGVGVCAVLIAVGLGKAGRAIPSVLRWRPLVFAGAFSYSIYLVHAPLLQLAWLAICDPLDLSREMTLVVMWFVATPIIVGLSYGFHLFAERPFMTARSPRVDAR